MPPRKQDATKHLVVVVRVDDEDHTIEAASAEQARATAEAVLDAARLRQPYRFDHGTTSTVVNFALVKCTRVMVHRGQGGAVNIRR